MPFFDIYDVYIHGMKPLYYVRRFAYLTVLAAERYFPYLTQKYDINGNLVNVFYNVGYEESYSYDANKRYLGHWIGSKFYAPDGKVTNYRY